MSIISRPPGKPFKGGRETSVITRPPFFLFQFWSERDGAEGRRREYSERGEGRGNGRGKERVWEEVGKG